MPDPHSRLATFLSELRQRRVFRVAAVYACVAFIIFQIVDATFDYLPIPGWVGTTLIVVLLLGFPIAVGMAWAFDLTEEGLVRTREIKRDQPKKPPRPVIGNKTLALVAVLAIIAAAWSWLREPSPGATPITSIAVLPFYNMTGDEDQEYFVEGMHDAFITELQRISALTVISRNSVMYYKDKDIRTPEIARQLKVDALVEGSVFRAGDQVRIIAQLIDGRTDKHLWANDYSRTLTDIIALQKSIASAIAQEIKVVLKPEEEIYLASALQVDPEAHEAYLMGRYYFNKLTEEGLNKGIEYFEQAIEKDPDYALAYGGLADSYVVLAEWVFLPPREIFPKARAAAMRALEIESTLAEARASLAFVRYFYDWDWEAAEKEFIRAIEINPSYSTAHSWYAHFLSSMGRSEEALVEIRRAQELDPLSLIISAYEGFILFFARQYDLAIAQCRKTLEMDPNFVPARVFLLDCYYQKGLDKEARAEFQIIKEIVGEAAALIHVWSVVAGRSEALEALNKLEKLSEQRYVSAVNFALVYASIGEMDQAFQWLEKAYEQHDIWLPLLKAGPPYDILRDDPRFADLLRRMNFPE